MTDRDTQTSEDDLLLIADAAVVARCSPATLRRWEARGLITAGRTPGGGYRVFRRGDLEKLAQLAPTRATS